MKIKVNLEKIYHQHKLTEERRIKEAEREIQLLESKWSQRMIPKTAENVKKYPDCFLRPNPDNPGYPICDKVKKEPQCEGLLAAYKRAAQQHAYQIKNKAKKIAKRIGCDWAESSDED